MTSAKEKVLKKNRQTRGEEEEIDTIEAPWKFMGGLDPENTRTMRRVMTKIHKAYNPSIAVPVGPEYNVKILTKKQRERVNAMLKEAADDNPLLVSILTWFGKKFNTTREESVLAAGKFIRDKVNQNIRHPRIYREEYKTEVKMWKAFLFDNDIDMAASLSKTEFEAMLITVKHSHIAKGMLAKRDLEDAGLVEDDVSFATAEDGDDTEPEEVLSKTEVKKNTSHNIFTEIHVAGYKKTRSGRKFAGSRSDYLLDDEELGRILEESRIEAEQAEEARVCEEEVEEKITQNSLAAKEGKLGAFRKVEKELDSTSFGNIIPSKRKQKHQK